MGPNLTELEEQQVIIAGHNPLDYVAIDFPLIPSGVNLGMRKVDGIEKPTFEIHFLGHLDPMAVHYSRIKNAQGVYPEGPMDGVVIPIYARILVPVGKLTDLGRKAAKVGEIIEAPAEKAEDQIG